MTKFGKGVGIRFNFNDEYSELGEDYVQVHHINPICDKDEEYEIDPINDMLPVCPNCHVMLHKTHPPYTPDELKKIMYG